MFRTNSNQDRVNYSNALLPPDGFVLEKAVGTTYSLDLEALTAVCIALGLKEDPDSDLLQNPISMLNALGGYLSIVYGNQEAFVLPYKNS